MKHLQILFSIFGSIFLLLLMAAGLSYAQEPLGPAFTYQGQLALNGEPVNAACDFQFGLYDAAGGGNQLGLTQTDSIPVNDGLFTALLNDSDQFGPDAFNGEARWLEISVQCPGDSGFTSLGRRPLTAAPYALYAETSGALDGLPLAAAAPQTGQVLTWDGAVWGPAAGIPLSSSWAITGNSGTDPAADFIGTTDDVTFTVRVSNTAALQIIPNATSPNLIGGYGGNVITPGVFGAVIAGGGQSGNLNRVTDHWGVIGGGPNNRVGNDDADPNNARFATVGGGGYNTASGIAATIGGGLTNNAGGNYATVSGGLINNAGGNYATVNGGSGNTTSNSGATVGGGLANNANGQNASIGGGSWNTAGGRDSTVGGGAYNNTGGNFATVGGGYRNNANGQYATIGGGDTNTAGGDYATVSGGDWSTANGNYSFAAGHRAKALHQGAFVWADSTAADYESTAENQFAVRATGGVLLTVDTSGSGLQIIPNAAGPNLIGGYSGNNIAAGLSGATINGGGQPGYINTITGTGNYATIAGGSNNTAGGTQSAIGGGATNTAGGYISTVAGGWSNTAGGYVSTVAGGRGNIANGNYAFVGGGWDNQANGGDYNAVGAGVSNLITTTDAANFIGGGYGNVISGTMGYATIGGGRQNSVGGGYATVAGGRGNTAGGDYATVAGGWGNTAGGRGSAVTGGFSANASHEGEQAHASGQFAAAGDAQASTYVLRRAATMPSGAWYDLFLDGSSALLTIAADRTVTFDILVTGSTAAGESAGYRIEGLIENDDGVTTLVGTPTVTTLGEDDAAWNVQVVANDTSDALLVQVQGNGETIRWVARVQTAEVNW